MGDGLAKSIMNAYIVCYNTLIWLLFSRTDVILIKFKWFLFLLAGFCAIKQKWGEAEYSQLPNPAIQMYKMIDISKHKCQVLEDVKDLAR